MSRELQVEMRAELVSFEHMMTEEAPRASRERRWWVRWFRRILPNRFSTILSVHRFGASASVFDGYDGDEVYMGIGPDAHRRARAYAQARNRAWRDDVRFVREEERHAS